MKDRFDRERAARLEAERIAEEATRNMWALVKKLEAREKRLAALNQSLDAAVQERTSQLEAALKELDNFASTVAHDLKSPLTSFNLKLALCRLDPKMDDASLATIAGLERTAQRMSGLIDAILAYSKSTAKAEAQIVDLNPVASEVAAMLEPQLGDATINIDPLPIILGDRTKWSQLLQNLLTNSLNYRSPSRPLVVKLSHATTDQGLHISIEDNGLGFANEDAPQLFAAFARGSTGAAGHGIGLATCQRIVEWHDGTIEATGEVDVGAKFTIKLPPGRQVAATS